MPPKEMPMRSKRALFTAALLFLALEICMGFLWVSVVCACVCVYMHL